MPRVISVHQYELKDEVEPARFEEALREVRGAGLVDLPGLETFYFGRGIRGARTDRYAAIWIYESRQAWKNLWGTPESPVSAEDYPDSWKRWEQEVLDPFLAGDPDRITYTSYETLDSHPD